MSDIQSIAPLEWQKAELEALVSEVDADGDVVGRLNFETRLSVVSRELAALRSKDDQVAEVALIFDGAPVDGTRTIDATFAVHALSYFQSIVTTLLPRTLRANSL